MSIKLDLNKFKHVKSDKHTTTLKHKDGHVLTIAVKALAPESQKQLQALSKLDDGTETSTQKRERLNENDRTPRFYEGGNAIRASDAHEIAAGARGDKPANRPENVRPTQSSSYGEASPRPKVSQSASNESIYAPTEAPAPEPIHQPEPRNDTSYARGGVVRRKYADGGEAETQSIGQVIGEAVRHAMKPQGPPRDEAQTEHELDQFEAQQPPTALQRSNMERQQARNQEQASPMQPQPSPMMKPGMPGYNEPAQPVEDTEMPPVGQPEAAPMREPTNTNAIDHGNDHYGNPNAQTQPDANSLDAELDAQPQQPSQPQAPGQPATQIPQEQMANMPVQQKSQELKDEDMAFQHDLNNGHITPKTYGDLFAKKSTLGKISSIFGLVLSSAGAGLAHQTPMAMEMMNKIISNDLEAQKTSKGNAYNFKNLNQQRLMQQGQLAKMQQEGLLTEAQAMNMMKEYDLHSDALAHMQANRAALHAQADIVARLPKDSPEYQKAQGVLAMMANGVDAMNSNLADKAAAQGALLDYANGGAGSAERDEQSFQNKNRILRMSGQEKLADDNESRHFPGLKGQASMPLNGADHQAINSGITFDKQLAKFMDWTKNHSGEIRGLNESDVRYGKALAADLQSAYREATHGGVFKESEKNFISQLIDETPTKFFNQIRVLPQLNAIQSSTRSKLDQLVKSKGFQGYQPSAVAIETKQQAPQEAVSKSGRPIIMRNGKWEYK